MHHLEKYLKLLDEQYKEMTRLLIKWADINSGSENILGLEEMLHNIKDDFESLGGQMTTIELPHHEQIDNDAKSTFSPLGKVLSIRKRSDARRKVFLCIHYDTVYPADDPFQQCTRIDMNKLRGPGVTDAKGGLVVMLKALECVEATPWAKNIGWEVFINPDEEIGSPGSGPLLAEAAKRNDLGLVFEPSLPDGNLVGARKGSGNFTVVIRGKAAHAGRSPELGRNAVNALADFIVKLNAMHVDEPGITVNVANVKGGGPLNVVPDLALCRFNVRVTSFEDQQTVQNNIQELITQISTTDGISLNLSGGFSRPPKQLDSKTIGLYELVRQCGKDLGISVDWILSGGSSDSNILAAAGLPTVDSLGVTGGDIHSSDEYVLLNSLPERAKLTALFLMKLATGKV